MHINLSDGDFAAYPGIGHIRFPSLGMHARIAWSLSFTQNFQKKAVKKI